MKRGGAASLDVFSKELPGRHGKAGPNALATVTLVSRAGKTVVGGAGVAVNTRTFFNHLENVILQSTMAVFRLKSLYSHKEIR